MSDLIYLNGKLSAGVTKLATHPGRIKERLSAAFIDSLLPVSAKSLPAEARATWDRVWSRVQAGAPRNMLTIEALNDGQAIEIAQDIVSVAVLVNDAMHDAEPR